MATNQYCQIPPHNVPVVEADGTMNSSWYKFFNDMHIVNGGADTPGHGIVRFDKQIWGGLTYDNVKNAVVGYFKEDTNLYSIYVYEQTTGGLLGKLLLDVIPR